MLLMFWGLSEVWGSNPGWQPPPPPQQLSIPVIRGGSYPYQLSAGACHGRIVPRSYLYKPSILVGQKPLFLQGFIRVSIIFGIPMLSRSTGFLFPLPLTAGGDAWG